MVFHPQDWTPLDGVFYCKQESSYFPGLYSCTELYLTIRSHENYLGEWGEISHSLEDCLPGLNNSEII